MSAMTSKLIVAGVLFLFTLLSGVWLSNSGKPYNSIIFGIHKLIAVATVIIIAMRVYNLYKALDLQTFVLLASIIVSGLLFLALVVTGSLLSLDIQLSGLALKMHQVIPLLALAFSSLTIYLLVGSKS